MRIYLFSPNEAAEILGVSKRSITNYCLRDNVRKQFNKYRISEHQLIKWGASKESIDSYLLGKDVTAQANQENDEANQETDIITQEFTEDQYNKLQNIILDYERIKKELSDTEQRFKDHIADLRNERDYLRNSLDKTSEQLQKVFDIMQQRNFIEAKDKGLDD